MAITIFKMKSQNLPLTDLVFDLPFEISIDCLGANEGDIDCLDVNEDDEKEDDKEEDAI